MDKKKLIRFFSEFWSIDVSKVDERLKLDDNTLNNITSVRLYQFFAKIESKFNVQVNNIDKIITFGDLLKNISDK